MKKFKVTWDNSMTAAGTTRDSKVIEFTRVVTNGEALCFMDRANEIQLVVHQSRLISAVPEEDA